MNGQIARLHNMCKVHVIFICCKQDIEKTIKEEIQNSGEGALWWCGGVLPMASVTRLNSI